MKMRTFSAPIVSIYDGQLFWFVLVLRSLDSCDDVINIITASLPLPSFLFLTLTRSHSLSLFICVSLSLSLTSCIM